MHILYERVGFLGTNAPLISDITLILVLLTAMLLTLGWRLAVHRRYKAHRWVQTSAVTLNTLVVILVMINSYIVNVLPGIPDRLGEASFGITTIHALVGLVSVILGVYVVLVANHLLPRRLRFTNYKLVMRTTYAFYMLATVLGVVVYFVVNV